MLNFDVFVIGSGMAGMTIANRCAGKGLKVGITDELPYGGTCALRGCDPKKVLIGASEVVDFAKRLQGRGIEGRPSIDWPELMDFKESFVDPTPVRMEESYKKNGIKTFHAPASFIADNRLQVGDETIEADKIVIATGAKPRDLGIPGKEYALTSTVFLNQKQLPESLLFIGGGYIAFEFAHLAARCGSKVTIIHRGEFPLEKFEQDIVKHLIAATKSLGIEIVLETEVTEIRKKGGKYAVTGKNNDTSTTFISEAVFNSSGRVPGIFDLNLQAANIRYNEKGVEVNEYLQNLSNPRVYAAGDAADTKGLPLTPVAVMEGHVVSSNIVKGNHEEADYSSMPTVVFALPAMASVGLTENEVKNLKLPYRVNHKSASDWFNARRLNEKEYAYKIIINTETGKIVGAHLIGPSAEESINIFSMAIRSGITANEIKKMLFSYPTLASDISSML